MMPFKKYEIITTVGPATSTPVEWEQLAASGATGFRLNTSHLSLPQIETWLKKFEPFWSTFQYPLVLDLQGSKWRLGDFPLFELKAGTLVTLIRSAQSDQPGILPVPHADFFQAAELMASGTSAHESRNPEILMNDAKILLRLDTASHDRMIANVQRGGVISSRKGITFAASDYRKESINIKDQAIVELSRAIHSIRFAISYVKDALEMERYRTWLGESVFLIAKLERKTALDEVHKIARIADELWLCRGDLGAELGLATLAEQTYRFSESIVSIPKPVLMAGQVLEHMTEHATPTRSEICYLYELLLRGYCGVVLSDETAIGRYPMESCQTATMFKMGNQAVIAVD
jgi:pyruvate kinase